MLYLGFLHGLQFDRNRCREGGSNNRAMTLYIHDPGPQVPRFNASYARPCSIGLLSGCWSSSIKKKRIQTMSRQTKNNFLTNKAGIPKGKPVERNVTNNNPSSTNRLISLSLACVADVWKERGRGLGHARSAKGAQVGGRGTSSILPRPNSLSLPFRTPTTKTRLLLLCFEAGKGVIAGMPKYIERFSYDFGFDKCSLFVLSANGWKDQNMDSSFFRQRKHWRHCSIGQSCCSVTSKRSIDWFIESSRACFFFYHPSVR